MDAEDPLFILYTSGSTGRPKGLGMFYHVFVINLQIISLTVDEFGK